VPHKKVECRECGEERRPRGKDDPILDGTCRSCLRKADSGDATLSRIHHLEDETRRSQKAEREAIARAVKAERLREAVLGATAINPRPPDWVVETSKASDAPHVPILVLSDHHFGEVILPGNMDGINEYNLAIAEQRYRTVIEKTIEMSFEHLPNNRYDGIVVLRLGDTVSGDIHDELEKTNELPTLPVCRKVVGIEEWGMHALADRFGRVHTVNVPGNHGRTTRKKESKGVTSQSYDQLVSWWLEDRTDDRVSFYTPESGDAVFSVNDRRYLATHGDRMGSGGGQGFVGPSAPIVRGMKKVHEMQRALGQPVDGVFIGHYHTIMDVGLGWSNGSLPGYSEYARDGRFSPENPMQWLLFSHPNHGITSQWKIRAAGRHRATREEILLP
jgi:hypothetical protein